MRNERGYTVHELIIAIVGIGSLALVIVGVYVLAHFILKHW